MADIFGFNGAVGDYAFQDPTNAGAAFKFNSTLLLVQNWNVQYQLQVQQLFECGSSKVYFAAKHGNGTCQISRVIAEKPNALTSNIGTVCDPHTGTITAVSGCKGVSSTKLMMENTILNGVGFQGQSQQAYVTEDVQIMFASLSNN
jgi:hypothetical protein